jgi:putative endopeptidase
MLFTRVLPTLGLSLLLLHRAPATLAETPEGFSVAHMDLTADPRVDFARFAAGGWYDRFEMPADKSRYGSFDALSESNLQRLRVILEAAVSDAPAGSIERQVGDFYAAAMNTAAIEAAGITPIADLLREIDTVADLDELAGLLGRLRAEGLGAFFGVWVGPDQRQSDRHALSVWQGGVSLPSRDYYFADQFAPVRQAFLTHVARLWELAGADADTAAAAATRVLDLETALAAHSRAPAELRDRVANYHRVSLPELFAALDALPLPRLLTAAGLDLAATDYAIIGQPEYLTGLNALLREHSIEDWRLYLRHRLLSQSAPRLTRAFEEAHFAFYGTVLTGTPEMEPRWKRAVRATDGALGEALGQLYVAKHYPPEAEARMRTMIDNIKAVMRDRLAHLDWMSPSTRDEALAKFDRFVARIGYPDTWRDYGEVRVTRDDYFANRRAADRFEVQRRFARLGGEVDPNEWGMTPPTVNAYFQPTANQIVFPAGILQPPFFDHTLDDAVNYGLIGAVIGHEITHGFDDQGRRYDAEGNLRDWWTAADAAEFARRAQRVIDQFDSYEALPGFFINGTLTQGENIADLGGVSIAFEALQRTLSTEDRPGLIEGFTPEQRFFIAWAQGWRTAYREEALRRQLIVGPHAPGQHRSVGPLVNLAEFHEAFGIQPGDPMWLDAAERAKIW